MADTKLAKVGITAKGPWKDYISFEVLDYALWMVQDGGDGCGYIAKRANIGVVPNSDDSVWIKATQAGQSIYDLAVKYGHFEGTEEEFEAEYQAVLQAARDAASETSATNTEIQEAEELRKTAENARVDAETARQTAETGRQTAETARETAETARNTAETQRGDNETTRQSQETARESAEQTRQTNESTRQSNETARESAEQERTADFEALKTDMETAIGEADAATAAAVALNNQVAGDESARQQAEQSRVSAENSRTAAETQRGTNESTRQTQETARQTAESTRNTQETARQTAEGQRATAEEGRASAESGRVSAEQSRVAAETAREEQSTSDHQRAEDDHAIAENDHATLDEKISHKADIDGSYDGMAVGIARNLEGRTNVTDSFFERTTGGDAEVANGTAQLNEVKGKSQVWNQLVGDDTESVVVVNGHKYLSVIGGVKAIGESDGNAIAVTGGTDMVIDLTLLGIDSLTTVEEVEAWLAENIGEMPYYPYNAGEVLNNKMTGVESIGFNLLDPATGKADIIGAYSDVYGNYYGITGTHGAMTFTDKFGNTETITPDEDGKFLLETAGTLSVADAGEDCAVFLWWDGTQTEFKPYEKNEGKLDVTHIYGKLNGTGDYVRVWPTGMPGIGDIKDSLKIVDGQVVAERKIAEMDMGTMNWAVDNLGTEHERIRSQAINLIVKRAPTSSAIGNGLSWNYKNVSSDDVYSHKEDKIICVGRLGQIDIYDTAFIGQTNEFVNSALSGILFYFELATSQVYTDLIYRDSESFADGTPVTLPVNYKVDNWGIERIAPQNTEEAVVTAKPELTMRYSIDAVEELNTHRDEVDDLYDKNEELDQRKPEKYGEYPDMAVGSAKTLAGNDTKVEDFFFKALDCADGLAKLNSARGKSLVLNQLVQNGNFVDTSTWVVHSSAQFSVSNNIATLIPGAQYQGITQYIYNARKNHKYYVAGDLYQETIAGAYIKGNLCGTNIIMALSEVGEWVRIRNIYTSGSNTNSSFGIGSTLASGWAEIKAKNLIIIDLTLMFGAGNEPATVEEFEAMFPLPYYDYNEGEIISNKTEEVKVTGFNQWDEEWEVGSIDFSTGANSAATGAWRTKDLIPVFPATSYFFRYVPGGTVSFAIFFYGKDGSYIGNAPAATNAPFTTIAGAYFIKFRFLQSGKNNDICINLSDPARNGEYEPYKTNTIELNLPTLTGKLNGEGESVVVFPDGLKSAGTAYDEIVGNKAIKRVGVVDLGTLTWVVRDAGGNYERVRSTGLNSLVPAGGLNIKANAICSKYQVDTSSNVYSHVKDKVFALMSSDECLSVYDSAFVGSTAADFKAAMSGVMLYYELATPEEYILDAPLPDTFQAYKGGTIKQLPENTSEPVTAPMVMTVTYAIDAVGTLVGLPRNYVSKESLQAMLNAMQSAGIIASYTMTYNENTGKYDFTFVAPTNS